MSKVRIDRFGRTTGGKPLARGALYLILQNRIYLGEIVHKENSYPGQHEAIVDQMLWEEVQRRLVANRVDRANGADAAQPSLLAGLVHDDAGERMIPSHANKKGTRYRYYVSQGLVKGRRRNAPRGRRVPAGEIEALVEDRLRQFMTSEADLYGAIEPHVADVIERTDLVARAADLPNAGPGSSRPKSALSLPRLSAGSTSCAKRWRSASCPAACLRSFSTRMISGIGYDAKRMKSRPSPSPFPPGSSVPAWKSGC